MQVKAQMFTKEGFYGPELQFKAANMIDVGSKLIREMERLPSTLEGIKQYDWTKITIEIMRS